MEEKIKMKKNGYSKEFRSMFREYDIRGLVNEEQLNEKSVYRIVKAYAGLIKSRGISKAVVGYDNRDCSSSFAESAIKALTDMGINVYFIGLTLSPVAYYAQYVYKCEGLVMITASHNPNGWSGFKLGLGYSTTLNKEEIIEVFNNVYGYFEALVRDNHAKDSAKFIRERSNSLLNYLEPTLLSFVAKVSESHGYDVIDVYGLK